MPHWKVGIFFGISHEVMMVVMMLPEGNGGRDSHRNIAENCEGLVDHHVRVARIMGQIMDQNMKGVGHCAPNPVA